MSLDDGPLQDIVGVAWPSVGTIVAADENELDNAFVPSTTTHRGNLTLHGDLTAMFPGAITFNVYYDTISEVWSRDVTSMTYFAGSAISTFAGLVSTPDGYTRFVRRSETHFHTDEYAKPTRIELFNDGVLTLEIDYTEPPLQYFNEVVSGAAPNEKVDHLWADNPALEDDLTVSLVSVHTTLRCDNPLNTCTFGSNLTCWNERWEVRFRDTIGALSFTPSGVARIEGKTSGAVIDDNIMDILDVADVPGNCWANGEKETAGGPIQHYRDYQFQSIITNYLGNPLNWRATLYFKNEGTIGPAPSPMFQDGEKATITWIK